MSLDTLVKAVEQWAEDRQLIQNSTMQAQLVKLVEEMGELAAGVAKKNDELIADSIGDCAVVLIILSRIHGHDLEQYLLGAYEEIRHRKGYLTPEGVFIKEEDI